MRLWRLENNQPVLASHPDMTIRSNVNGYGGGALCLLGDCAYVVDGASQQISKVELATGSMASLTRDSDSSFGGLVADPVRNRLLAVRELTLTDGAVRQQLVAVDIASGSLKVVREGDDFYGAAAVSDDGGCLAWVTWQLPDMPWQQSRLWFATVEETGELSDVCSCDTPTPASVQQPGFIGNDLVVLSDHLGWWQPFRVEATGAGRTRWQALSEVAADHGNAPWQLGERQWTGVEASGWASVRYQEGFGELWYHSGDHAAPQRLAIGYVDFRALQGVGSRLICIARRSDATDSVLEIDLRSGSVKVLAGGEQPLPASDCILPSRFRFQAKDGQTVTGLYYRPPGPQNSTVIPTQPPPLIVLVHGGPTSAAYPVFDPQVQFWAHHGFAVAAVNYRGSTGFGRLFRQSLAQQWGVSDVEDVQAAVVYLAGKKLADAGRAFVQGRSAGGYTALMALVDSDVFLAGASLFGVSDPARLRTRTHRFESGYLDWLLGDPETHARRWQDRTPVAQSHRIKHPVIFFQGGQDKVVVPQQTEAMVAALSRGGFEPEYHYFAEEGHGFRQPDRQVFMLERLLDFYQRHCAAAGAH
ncbi:alpha/beta hydrolase family protein [Marinobacter changyiensis]|uniref:alpha/beta hydrolase family protein n=1 Tax=Marinobacter changyiensis TaxID=2604091 RepID=UPI001FE98F4E|nr:prolyl oligopeptidase family serine peptidase [Marinobacter changyiensis]